MTTKEINILRKSILKGIGVSYNKLLTAAQHNDEELVVSKNGQVSRIKARKLKTIKVEDRLSAEAIKKEETFSLSAGLRKDYQIDGKDLRNK